MTRLLIVEDQPEIRELMRLTLRDLPVEIHEADNGPAALDIVATAVPTLVLLDVNLRGDLDGFEICRRMKQAAQVPIVIVISTRARIEDRDRGVEAGADYYLTKPFSPAELERLVKLALTPIT